MAFDSVDHLQKVLTEQVFHYAQDSKKAAGRALGMIVEIITFYLLKTWELEESISIERSLAEYGNPDITHNVEYSLHPILKDCQIEVRKDDTSITANKILKSAEVDWRDNFEKKGYNLLSNKGILRNACTIASGRNSNLVATLVGYNEDNYCIKVCQHANKPLAIFECKRVGVEEGTRKGPQTIEKAKQGAYVARAVSSLQKVRLGNGELYGIIYQGKELLCSKPYYELLQEVIYSDNPELLKRFILTVGVVSNHGNWFTSEDHNKELKVLAQSYDWLIFLTDEGMSEFVCDLILEPSADNVPVRNAFLASYTGQKTKNQFTKVQMNFNADAILSRYFRENIDRIEGWFNVISPVDDTIEKLKRDLFELKSKEWEGILK